MSEQEDEAADLQYARENWDAFKQHAAAFPGARLLIPFLAVGSIDSLIKAIEQRRSMLSICLDTGAAPKHPGHWGAVVRQAYRAADRLGIKCNRPPTGTMLPDDAYEILVALKNAAIAARDAHPAVKQQAPDLALPANVENHSSARRFYEARRAVYQIMTPWKLADELSQAAETIDAAGTTHFMCGTLNDLHTFGSRLLGYLCQSMPKENGDGTHSIEMQLFVKGLTVNESHLAAFLQLACRETEEAMRFALSLRPDVQVINTKALRKAAAGVRAYADRTYWDRVMKWVALDQAQPGVGPVQIVGELPWESAHGHPSGDTPTAPQGQASMEGRMTADAGAEQVDMGAMPLSKSKGMTWQEAMKVAEDHCAPIPPALLTI